MILLFLSLGLATLISAQDAYFPDHVDTYFPTEYFDIPQDDYMDGQFDLHHSDDIDNEMNSLLDTIESNSMHDIAPPIEEMQNSSGFNFNSTSEKAAKNSQYNESSRRQLYFNVQ